MDKQTEYGYLVQLEQQTTNSRHTTFVALLSISFILPGLAVQDRSNAPVEVLWFDLTIGKLVFFLGFLFYLFAVFHYGWYHRYSHRYRKALKEIEKQLGICVYRLRARPQLGPFKFHFDWSLLILGMVYGTVTASYVGSDVFWMGIGSCLLFYMLLLGFSRFRPVEIWEDFIHPQHDDKVTVVGVEPPTISTVVDITDCG